MSPVVESAAWVAGIWTAIALAAAVIHRRSNTPAPLPQRTPEDVWADAAAHRRKRETAKQQREEGQ